MDAYLFLVTSPNSAKAGELTIALSSYGQAARALDGVWLLAVDADKADKDDINAGSLLEALLDKVSDELEITVVEVDNIATYNITEDGEDLLDELFGDEEGDEEE